ncbi:hypothetical protein [Tolypothrix sp. VBCCA 56010]|uniref:hypothetical protein n=1 Tax=Tolypothrix sp. VBCCA 56010 TaxID=3137731 RepID=UPI003D7E5DA0|nr:hypothetical protein [Tolypothrix carrinoi HA7290-LM1]
MQKCKDELISKWSNSQFKTLKKRRAANTTLLFCRYFLERISQNSDHMIDSQAIALLIA